MANMAFVNIDELDADMLSLANTIRSKGDTTEKLEWPTGFESAVEAISTGPTIQIETGTFTTNYSGNATVNCGFKPDAVFFTDINPQNNDKVHAGVAFTEANLTSVVTLFAPFDMTCVFSYITVAQTSSGFTVKSVSLTGSFTQINDSNRSFNYIAIKYTE